MTVCKKCNVEVSDYLTKCPLCKTKLKDSSNEDSPYNDEIENFSRKVNIIYFSKLIIKLLMFASLITMICNIVINKKLSWSLYVLFSSAYISSYYIFIISKNIKLSLTINFISLELLLGIIAYLSNGINWFIYLVGPFTLLFYGFILLNLFLASLTNILRNFSYYLMYILVSLFLIDGFIKLYNTRVFNISWSIYSNVPLFIISFLLFGLSFNKRIQNEFEKRFFN